MQAIRLMEDLRRPAHCVCRDYFKQFGRFHVITLILQLREVISSEGQFPAGRAEVACTLSSGSKEPRVCSGFLPPAGVWSCRGSLHAVEVARGLAAPVPTPSCEDRRGHGHMSPGSLRKAGPHKGLPPPPHGNEWICPSRVCFLLDPPRHHSQADMASFPLRQPKPLLGPGQANLIVPWPSPL